MSAIVTSPEFSFVRWDNESLNTCNPKDVRYCLPIVNDDDVAFQFIVETDTEAEADELTQIGVHNVDVGITHDNLPNISDWYENYSASFIYAERIRIAPK